MKIYVEPNIETDSVEILLNHNELKMLVKALGEFENEIDIFKKKAQGKSEIGFTHLHLKDCGVVDKNGNTDIVFYLNLSE